MAPQGLYRTTLTYHIRCKWMASFPPLPSSLRGGCGLGALRQSGQETNGTKATGWSEEHLGVWDLSSPPPLAFLLPTVCPGSHVKGDWGPCLFLSLNSGSFSLHRRTPRTDDREKGGPHRHTHSGVVDTGCQRGELGLLVATLPPQAISP